MRNIAIDTRVINNGVDATGIQKYAYYLIKELLADTSEKIILLGDNVSEKFDQVANIQMNLPLSDHHLANKMLSLTGYLEDFDLLFSPFLPIPERRTFKGVLTIHDMAPLVNSSWFVNDMVAQLFNTTLKSSAQNCDHIIVDSEATKRDVSHYYDIHPDHISVIYLAAASPPIADSDETEVSQLVPRLNKPYLLSVCTLQPRKNLLRALKAYELLRDRRPSVDYSLVLTGSMGWKNEELMREIRANKYADDIIVTGYVSDQKLVQLYKHAEMFIYPSLYEGFGLPVLEAMSMGVPVVTSNVSSLPEVGGDAVEYCDPYEIETIAEAMARVIDSPILQAKMRAEGLARAKQFTWQETARQTREVFLKCLNS